MYGCDQTEPVSASILKRSLPRKASKVTARAEVEYVSFVELGNLFMEIRNAVSVIAV